jgi:hypothetical protein
MLGSLTLLTATLILVLIRLPCLLLRIILLRVLLLLLLGLLLLRIACLLLGGLLLLASLFLLVGHDFSPCERKSSELPPTKNAANRVPVTRFNRHASASEKASAIP